MTRCKMVGCCQLFFWFKLDKHGLEGSWSRHWAVVRLNLRPLDRSQFFLWEGPQNVRIYHRPFYSESYFFSENMCEKLMIFTERYVWLFKNHCSVCLMRKVKGVRLPDYVEIGGVRYTNDVLVGEGFNYMMLVNPRSRGNKVAWMLTTVVFLTGHHFW